MGMICTIRIYHQEEQSKEFGKYLFQVYDLHELIFYRYLSLNFVLPTGHTTGLTHA